MKTYSASTHSLTFDTNMYGVVHNVDNRHYRGEDTRYKIYALIEKQQQHTNDLLQLSLNVSKTCIYSLFTFIQVVYNDIGVQTQNLSAGSHPTIRLSVI